MKRASLRKCIAVLAMCATATDICYLACSLRLSVIPGANAQLK